MKKPQVLLVAGLLILSTSFAGCSASKSLSNASKDEASSSSTSVSVAKKAEETTAAEEKAIVVFEENGLKLTYTGFEDGIIPKFTFMLENNSDKSYSVMSEDESINDCMITMSLIESIAPGKKSAVNMSFFDSELEKNKIDKIEKLEFKLHYSNSDKITESYDSGVITITNP